MRTNFCLFVISFLVISLTSCKKEEDYAPVKYAEEKIIIPANLPEHDGLFLAIRDMIGVDITGTQEIGIDITLAQIGKPVFSDVGQVKLNNKELFKGSNFQYSSDLEKLNFDLSPGKQNKWSIEGGNGFAAFEKTLSNRMPAKIVFQNVPGTVSQQKGISLQIKDVPNNAQSIIWTIKDVDGNELYKETTINEVNFSASELQTLTLGKNSLIKIVAYNIETYSNNGKNYVFINETVETADIDIVP